MKKLPLSRIKTRYDEARYWAEQALAYYESSMILASSESEFKSMPIITLQAFSAECSLKSLILLSTSIVKVRGHELKELFEALSSDLQTNLSQSFFDEFDRDLIDALQEVSTDFIDSRYYHEELKRKLFGRSFAVGYLEAISKFLLDFIEVNGDSLKNESSGT